MLFPPKQEKKKNWLWLRLLLAVFFILLVILTASYLVFEEIYKNKIYPGLRLNQIDLSALSREETKKKLEEKIDGINQNGIRFRYQESQTALMPIISSLGGDLAYEIISFETNGTIDRAFNFGRSDNFFKDLGRKIKMMIGGQKINMDFNIEEEEIKNILYENFHSFERPGKDAALMATTSKDTGKLEFWIIEEKAGFSLDYKKAMEKLRDNLSLLDASPIEITIKKDYPNIYKSDCLNIEAQAKKIMSYAPLTLVYEDKKWEVDEEEILFWLTLARGVNDKIIIDIDLRKAEEFLRANVIEEINKAAVDARFEIKDNRVAEFVTSQDGIMVNIDKTIFKIRSKFLAGNEKEVELVVEVEKSNVSNEDVNDLGIKEIIGIGHSNFVGSPPNRIHNIKTGANSLSGILIKPDEEFSLNNALGEINAETGYLPELVIKGNKTIPEYGGGLCQIGTTMFRVALGTGLPITHRRNHSYRVSYYEPAGTDATIYNPWPDLKFINDTGNHILIQHHIDGNDLYFDFWGTKDGRSVERTDPTIYNIIAPGPTKYIETADLAVGEEKCTEIAHNGADAYFDYKVTYANKEVKEERFKSHYVPWRKVCLIGVEKISTSSEEAL